MISFRLTFVLCALVFGQSLASTIQTSTAVESKEIDIIVKVVNALEKLGDAALDIATKIVDYSIKNVHDLPKEISAHAGKFLNKISAVIVKVLEIVKKNVNKDASVVVTCTEALSKDFATNYGTTVKDTLDCVDPNLEKVLVIIPDVLKQLGAILKKVEGVTANLNKCAGGPLKEIACLLDITKKSINEAKGLTQIVIDAYHHMKAAVGELYSKSEKCLHGVLDKIEKDALTRINNYGTCCRTPAK